jgi:uncharacterized RDD family membrane protein YckC
MSIISITTSQNIELEYELGSLGDRIVGRIIDGLIIIAYVILLFVLFNLAPKGSIEGNYLLLMLFFLPIVFYDLVSEILMNGQSVGKKVMGIKVISLSGEQPSYSQYLIRWLFRLIDFSFSGSLVAFITVAVTEKKQRLGDIVAGTVLIKTNPRTELSQTIYQPLNQQEYKVTYPEVPLLSDNDIQLVKEVITTVRRTGNSLLALQAQQKVEQVLEIQSKNSEPIRFLQTILLDYNYLTSLEQD